MAAFSDFLENKLVDHLFRTTTYARSASLWVALYTVAPSDSGGGTEVTTTGSNYARVNLAPADTNWTATQGGTSGASSGTGGHTDNAVAITFGAPSADWGQVVAFGIHTAQTAGDLLFHGTLTTPKTINNSDPAPSFAIGDLDITLA